MSRPTIEAVTSSTLLEFARFLSANLQFTRSPEDWVKAFQVQWAAEQPNHGFVLRDEGQIVGGIGAFYADRLIRGQLERFCNITSWCVLDAYRQQSMRLAMTVVGQPGYHFTDFSPTKVVGGTLKFFKFKELDERVGVILNLPAIGGNGGARVVGHAEAIDAHLSGQALKTYRDHAVFPWLQHALVGKPGAWCHVIYKRSTFKGLPAAQVIHLSVPALFEKHFSAFASHALGQGMVSTHVECRFLKQLPWPSRVRSGFNPKLYLSTSLGDADIDYLYSETMALDL